MLKSDVQIILKPGREAAVRRRHPWIFSGAVERVAGTAAEGDIVSVHAHGGEFLGVAHYSTGSISLKMLSYDREFDPRRFLEQRIARAIELRQSLGLLKNSETTGFRLINAEGDGLPGLVVDLYESTAVVQFHSFGMARFRDDLSSVLRKLLGSRLSAIYDKSKDLAGNEAAAVENGYVWGSANSFEFIENGHRFIADWENGQKTGFFLDQRENRKLLGSLSKAKSVLNCFSYTGGFSVYALAGEASQVVSVDSSAAALQILERNIALNIPKAAHRCVEADCMQYLQKLDQTYDIIVLDPPAFIKHRGALRGGIKGYETINHLALKQIKAGGLLFSFSCSQLLLRADFYEMLERSALRAGRSARVLYEMRQAPCHPVNLAHPEGEYLKGLVLEIG